MASLTEVYDGSARDATSLRRLYAGTALVLLGAVLSVVAVLLATTDLFAGVVETIAGSWASTEQYPSGETELYASVRIAGALAGLGVPAVLVGIFMVLPAGRWVRAAGAISASLCLLGVTLFWYAYPIHWRGHGEELTLQVSAVYLLGLFIAVWCLFTAVVNFKTRNDPGGMLEMNVTRRNQTVVEVSESEDESAGLGGIGFFGGTPDGEVETQTNAPTQASDGANASSDDATVMSYDEETATSSRSRRTAEPTGPGTGAATSDGGSTTADISSPLDDGPTAAQQGRDAVVVDGSSAADDTELGDRYCGNCEHFEYVRSSSGMVPYCARHEETMDDMDACDAWSPNRR
ncbi:DUF7139 domain-containing protein [Halopiger goleimassiliensis]|uniref:DUF7139 domain-containing protein n=1 Tax=Halopiger goleimassiliensis TaxID=1293048 RepID=UPI0006776C76|nr:hypothetical protein [Halopiger goleimassiliensis]